MNTNTAWDVEVRKCQFHFFFGYPQLPTGSNVTQRNHSTQRCRCWLQAQPVAPTQAEPQAFVFLLQEILWCIASGEIFFEIIAFDFFIMILNWLFHVVSIVLAVYCERKCGWSYCWHMEHLEPGIPVSDPTAHRNWEWFHGTYKYLSFRRWFYIPCSSSDVRWSDP